MKKSLLKNTMCSAVLFTLLGFLLLFNCGCGRQEKETAPTAAEAAAAPVAAPLLEVDGGNERDLGTINEHDVVPLEFTLRNAGESALTIIDATLSCPCGDFLNPPDELELQPGETFLLKLNMLGHKLPLGKFSRFFSLDLGDEKFVSVTLNGQVKANFEISPSRMIDLGKLRDSGATWEKDVRIKGVNQLAEGFRLAAAPKSAFFALQLSENAPGDYNLKITPKSSLPYTRRFRSDILLPIAEPAGLPDLRLRVRAQIGETIAFKPGNFSFQETDFAESETLSRTAIFGTPPIEETEKLVERAKNASQLPFQSFSRKKITSLDWEPLFAHLEFDCPEGVRVEKKLHEEGISLQIHVDRDAFAENQRLSIVPRRDQNKFQKINLTLRREGSDNTAEQSSADDDDAEDESAEEEE